MRDGCGGGWKEMRVGRGGGGREGGLVTVVAEGKGSWSRWWRGGEAGRGMCVVSVVVLVRGRAGSRRWGWGLLCCGSGGGWGMLHGGGGDGLEMLRCGIGYGIGYGEGAGRGVGVVAMVVLMRGRVEEGGRVEGQLCCGGWGMLCGGCGDGLELLHCGVGGEGAAALWLMGTAAWWREWELWWRWRKRW